MARVARFDLRTAARGGVVLLLMGALVSGFGESDGLILGSAVSATPTVGILGGAVPNGAQVSGEVASLNTLQGVTRLVLATTGGYVTVELADPFLAAGLGVGQTVVLAGQFTGVDLFSAYYVISSGVYAGGDLTLGAPLSNPGTLGAPLGASGSGSVTLGSSVGGGTACSGGNSSGSGCPKVELKLSDAAVDKDEAFTITVEARDDDGIESLWWWATATDDNDLSQTHTYDCRNASPCKKSRDVRTKDAGTLVIHAQARDAFGQLSREVKAEIKIR